MSQTQQRASSEKTQEDSGLIVFQGFSGLNTQASRPGIEDAQLAICDGFCPVGESNLRTIWDNGPPLFTAPFQVVTFDFANIGATPYCIAFLSDGSVWAINTNTNAAAVIAPGGSIANPASAGLTQWGSQFVIIVALQTDGYFVWDGTIFYFPGMTVPGSAGGVVPTGIHGTAAEIYSGHVWIVSLNEQIWSAPGSIVDFTTANGGGNTVSNDSFLRVQYTQIKQSNGYLYLFGDSSISYIAGVQTSGSPATTTFTQQSVDPEVGTPWPGTVDLLGSNIIFANPWGAHVSYGGRAAKVSGMLDGIYNTVPFFGGGPAPTAAKHIMFGKRIWALLLPVIDQYTGQHVNKLLIWDEKRWFSTQQSVNLIFVQHQEINSVLTAYGSDGNAIYPLFAAPSTNVLKIARSKFWGNGSGLAFLKSVSRLWGVFQLFNTVGLLVNISIDSEQGSSGYDIQLPIGTTIWTNNSGAPLLWTNNVAAPLTWGVGTGPIVVIPPQAVGQNGVLIGLTLTTHAADIALWSLAAMPAVTQYRG